MSLHRVQVERELRTALLKLREIFVLSRGDAEELRTVMAKSISTVRALARHTLMALGERPLGSGEVFAQVAAKTGADAAAFEAVLDLRNRGRATVERSAMVGTYGAYLKALEAVIDSLDRHPKAEWRRAGTLEFGGHR